MRRRQFLALPLLLASPLRARGLVNIAAASDLRYALDDLAVAFRKTGGAAVNLIYGSSGLLYQQILAGAPFQLFLSADESYVKRLETAGRTMGNSAIYALGRLVLVASHQSSLAIDADMRGLAKALEAGRIKRFAIASPEHAPYGLRAREALQSAGLWAAIRPHLVIGENVSQALQFATAGGADGGIVARSLTRNPGFSRLGRTALMPGGLHQPLLQRMVRMKGSGADADTFFRWLQTPTARAIFQRYGFALPSDTTAGQG